MPYLTIDEFAEEHGLTRAEVKTHICDGMPAEPGPDGPRLIPEDEALEWMAEQGLLDDDDDEDDLEEEDLDEDEEE